MPRFEVKCLKCGWITFRIVVSGEQKSFCRVCESKELEWKKL